MNIETTNSGVFTVTPEIEALIIINHPKSRVYPWYTTPLGAKFARTQSLTSGKTVYPPAGVKKAGIVYKVTVGTFHNDTITIYERVK